MPAHALDDTIAALATPAGSGALAVVRVSGADAIGAAARVFRGKRSLLDLGGFEGAHGWIHGAEGPVDEVIAWVYRAPRSFTGEDMVEISCHGGSLPAQTVLETLWTAGARPANPGEFTRRAFLNGRLDLSQAEAVADLISARGRRAQEQALVQLQGGLSRRVRDAASRVRSVLAEIEGHLDFGEDVPEIAGAEALAEALGKVESDLARLARSHGPSRRIREGMVVALTGRPNVGKSSLLNAMVGYDRAIVHDSPGTTRDVVDALVDWAGIPVRLLDTAGLRSQAEAVEQEGITRSQAELRRADLVLWVVDGSTPETQADQEIAGMLDLPRTHVVCNKMDLANGSRGGWVNNYSPRGVHRTSAKTGEGIGSLVEALEGELTREVVGAVEGEDVWLANERHAHELGEAAGALARARVVLGSGEPLELGASDLQRCLAHLASVTGDQAGEDLLDEIFRRFCIGK